MDQFKKVKDTYNDIAQEYCLKRSNPEHSTWNDYIEFPAIKKELVNIVTGKKVLDLGCGSGILSGQINKWGGTVLGVDQSIEMLNIARKDFPHIKFFEANIIKLPFEDDLFDIVTSSLVMHYIKDLEPVFQETNRVLKNNGIFIFSMHHPFNESFNIQKKKDGNSIIMKPYFHNDPYYWKMCNTEFLSFHHTFENIFSSLSKSNLVVEKLVECRPIPEAKEKFSEYEFTSQFPTFCLFKTRKLL